MNATDHDRAALPRMLFAQWWAVLGPPLVWLTQFEARYALAGNAPGSRGHVAMVVIAIVSLILIGTAVVSSWRQWRWGDASPLDRAAGVGERAEFMGALGLLSSGLFFLAIVAQVLAEFFISPGKP
jgi:hypothetical protein